MLEFTNLKEFEDDLEQFVNKAEIDINTAIKRLAFEAFRGVVQRTPVRTGWARGAWTINAGFIDTTIPPNGSYSEENPMPAPKATQFDGISGKHDSYYIANSVPYILMLEAGHSKQMDKGYMVERTMNDITKNFQSILKGK